MELTEPMEHSRAKCPSGHPLTFVAEGYAFCQFRNTFYAWKYGGFIDHPVMEDRWEFDSEGRERHLSLNKWNTEEAVIEFIKEDIGLIRLAYEDLKEGESIDIKASSPFFRIKREKE